MVRIEGQPLANRQLESQSFHPTVLEEQNLTNFLACFHVCLSILHPSAKTPTKVNTLIKAREALRREYSRPPMSKLLL